MSFRISLTPSGGIKIKQVASFDFQKVYSAIRDWYDSREYTFQEKENTHKDQGPGGEFIIKLNGVRPVDSYVDYYVNISIKMFEIVKLKVDNKTVDHGFVEIIIEAGGKFDTQHLWSKNKFSKFLGFIYNNYLIKKKIDEKYLTGLYIELIELTDAIKAQLH